jgi:hypothetical protein
MKYPSNLIFVFYCRQIRIGNRYHEQLGDVLQILLAFYFLSLGDFGISPRYVKLFDIIHKEVLPCEETYIYL